MVNLKPAEVLKGLDTRLLSTMMYGKEAPAKKGVKRRRNLSLYVSFFSVCGNLHRNQFVAAYSLFFVSKRTFCGLTQFKMTLSLQNYFEALLKRDISGEEF